MRNLKAHKHRIDKASGFANILLLICPHTEFQVGTQWKQKESGLANISSAMCTCSVVLDSLQTHEL